MGTFKDYLKEQEELTILSAEKDKKEKLVSLFRDMEDLNNDKFREFAINEIGLSEEEADTIVFKMLRDFLLKDAESEVSDELDDEEGDLEGLGDIADGDIDDTPLLDVDDDDTEEIPDEEDVEVSDDEEEDL